MAETLRSDGNAVDVTVDADVTKGEVVLVEGFFGIAMADALSGEDVALEIGQREHEINVGEVSAAKGAVLYLTDAGAITATVGSNTPFLKVTVAKDANDYVWGILLPQA